MNFVIVATQVLPGNWWITRLSNSFFLSSYTDNYSDFSVMKFRDFFPDMGDSISYNNVYAWIVLEGIAFVIQISFVSKYSINSFAVKNSNQ